MPSSDDKSTSDWNWDEAAIARRKVRADRIILRAQELSKHLEGVERKIFDLMWPFNESHRELDKATLAKELGISVSELDDKAFALFSRLLKS